MAMARPIPLFAPVTTVTGPFAVTARSCQIRTRTEDRATQGAEVAR
jgi:hypothetical protein